MASLDTGGDSGHKKGPGVKKAKKQSTRVDMTPMVDLGFLLITFFIFTTTLSTPSTLALNMPKDEKDPKNETEVKESSVLTIMLAKGNNVFYYEGKLAEDASNFKSSNFKDIRPVIINKRKDVISRHVHDGGCEKLRNSARNNPESPYHKSPDRACEDKDFMVIIKPGPEATYKNTVDIMDEMKINGAQRYAIVDILPIELELIRLTEIQGGVK
jgi:biopolymer transport protein ExbD